MRNLDIIVNVQSRRSPLAPPARSPTSPARTRARRANARACTIATSPAPLPSLTHKVGVAAGKGATRSAREVHGCGGAGEVARAEVRSSTCAKGSKRSRGHRRSSSSSKGVSTRLRPPSSFGHTSYVPVYRNVTQAPKRSTATQRKALQRKATQRKAEQSHTKQTKQSNDLDCDSLYTFRYLHCCVL